MRIILNPDPAVNPNGLRRRWRSARHRRAGRCRRRHVADAQRPDEGIDEIAKRIREKPNAEYPVADLAKEADLSLSAFANAFKRAMGLPLHAYVLNCRINRAKRLLLTTKSTVTSIGQELHFYSTQHFALTFKRIVGKYPKDFRLSAQADQKSANA